MVDRGSSEDEDEDEGEGEEEEDGDEEDEEEDEDSDEDAMELDDSEQDIIGNSADQEVLRDADDDDDPDLSTADSEMEPHRLGKRRKIESTSAPDAGRTKFSSSNSTPGEPAGSLSSSDSLSSMDSSPNLTPRKASPVRRDIDEELEQGDGVPLEDSESESDPDSDSSRLPDASTKRGRNSALYGEGELQALPMEPQKRKVFTEEEHAMRRADMARRRKNLSAKKNEEEKADTINRLLKKQAPRGRGAVKILANAAVAQTEGGVATEEAEEIDQIGQQPPTSTVARWTCNPGGRSLAIPNEWLRSPLGEMFRDPRKATCAGMSKGMMVEEVEG